MDLKLDGLGVVFDDDKVNNGVWVQLESFEPDADGVYQPLFLDPETKRQPQRVLVRSYRCQAIRRAEEKLSKEGFVRVQRAKKNDRDKAIVENSFLKDSNRFGYFLVAVDNVSRASPGIQHVSYDDAVEIHDMSEFAGLVQAVKEIAYEDKHYLAGPATDPGNVAAPTITKSTETASPND